MNKNINIKPVQQRTPEKTEWLTLTVIGVNYLVFAGLSYFYHVIPLWLLIPLAGFSLALYSSLQHEVLHGHPTPWQWLNELLLFPALILWIPYALYKETHLQHHNNQHLTDPGRDPESFYLPAERWQAMPHYQQQFFRLLNTFTGRILLGPIYWVAQLFYHEALAMLGGDRRKLRIWGVHLLATVPVWYWVTVVCGLTVWQYLLFFVYPGIALSLVRSYLEHRAVADPAHRSVIVEAGPVMSLLFLNNNLHAIHHEQPGLAWYRLPGVWRQQRDQVLAGNDHYYYTGYAEVLSKFALRVKEPPAYPLPTRPVQPAI